MPSVSEHKKKYLENKDIAENVLDIEIEGQRNWIATLCFYAALHIVDMQLAEDEIHSKTHIDREKELDNNCRITQYVKMRYKHMSTMSRMARYDATAISKPVANQMLTFLHHIEAEYNLL